MFALPKWLGLGTILLSHSLYAGPYEDYEKICTENQGNGMGPKECECMRDKSKGLTKEEFDFFYAIAAKDQDKVNKGHVTLDATQKMNVMQLSMMGPSKCANEIAKQENSQEQQDSSASATGAASATTSDTVSESVDSASQYDY